MAYQLNLDNYIFHLLSIRDRLIDFNQFIEEGRKEYLEDISQKLRILFIRKSGTDPLITTVMNLLCAEFVVSVIESFEEGLKRKGLEHHLSQVSVGIQNEINYWFEPNLRKIEIIEAFNRSNIVILGNHNYSAKEIVEIMADKMGGAHIDAELMENHLLPHTESVKFGNNTLASHFILSASSQAIRAINIIEGFVKNNDASEFIIKNEHNTRLA